MAYITSDDLLIAVGGSAKLLELSDLDDDEAIDPAVVAQAIARAESIVNGYLQQRYQTPIADPPDLVINLTLDLARWYLASNRNLGDLELYRRAYQDAITLLKDIAAGRMQLDIATKPTGSTLVTGGGLLTPDSHADGGMFWDAAWRNEGSSDEDDLV